MGMSAPQVYNVPWRLRMPDLPPVTAGLVLYWFPSSVEEVQKSSMRTSRVLSLYAAQCVSMEIADAATPLGQKLVGADKLPVAVLATPGGDTVAKIENQDGFLRAEKVEKIVDGGNEAPRQFSGTAIEAGQGTRQVRRQYRGDPALPRRSGSEMPFSQAGERCCQGIEEVGRERCGRHPEFSGLSLLLSSMQQKAPRSSALCCVD